MTQARWRCDSRHAGTGVAVSNDDVVRALAIKGYAMGDMLGLALGVSAEEAAALVERLAADGIAKDSSGMFSLTDDGKALGAEMIAADSEAWGVANATAALDAFIVLDHQMKSIVTAWQMKEVDGEQVLNDHADADYDAAVLQRLAELHVEDERLDDSPLFAGLPRLASYGRRLDAAAAEGRRRRRHVHRQPARRQLPRGLVRAARGPHPTQRQDARG